MQPRDTNLSTVLVSIEPMTAHARSRAKSRLQVGGEITDVTAPYLSAVFGAADSASFWKRGSLRNGSNMGSSRRNAGVSGTVGASGASYGIESSFCNAAIARSGSPIRAATRVDEEMPDLELDLSFSLSGHINAPTGRTAMIYNLDSSADSREQS
jgi:hypothetical protein